MKKQKNKDTKNKKLGQLFLVVSLAIVLAAGLIFIVMMKDRDPQDIWQGTQETVAEGNNDATKTEATSPESKEPFVEMTTIETKYCTLAVPSEYSNDIKHKEIIEGSIALEIFSADIGNEEIELFRIYFGDESMGSLMGYLIEATESIPISYDVCYYEDSFFKSDADKAAYYRLMDGYVVIMDSVYNDSRFTEDKPENSVDEKQAVLTHWSVMLPENVIWEEITNKNLYQVDFYGIIRGEKVRLYSVGLGEMEADYSIGVFLVEGEARTVCVKVCALPIDQNWSEDEISTGYRMLETVNDVIDAIMSSKNFSEQIPE